MKTKLLLFAGLLFAFATSAAAQNNTAERLQALETRIQSLEAAQDGVPLHDFQLTGYMSALYSMPEEGPTTFSTGFNPLFLYKAGERFLFEAELELGFEGEATEFELEYAQLNYMIADNASIGAGKFLLPFGIFGERGHPSWINRFPSPPPIYGGHGGFPGAIIPVLSDFGVQTRGAFRTGGLRWNYAVYAVNGPRATQEDAHGGGHGGPEYTVNFSSTPEDENQNKAAGFRLGFLPGGNLEVGISYYAGEMTYTKSEGVEEPPGEEATNPITMTMVDFSYRWNGLDVRAEYLKLDTSKLDTYVSATETEETWTVDAPGGPGDTITKSPPKVVTHMEVEAPQETTGYWIQTGYRLRNLPPELVLRYGAVTQKHEEGEEEVGNQFAVAFNWWLEPSLVLKTSAITNSVKDHTSGATDTTTNYFVQLAFGF